MSFSFSALEGNSAYSLEKTNEKGILLVITREGNSLRFIQKYICPGDSELWILACKIGIIRISNNRILVA